MTPIRRRRTSTRESWWRGKGEWGHASERPCLPCGGLQHADAPKACLTTGAGLRGVAMCRTTGRVRRRYLRSRVSSSPSAVGVRSFSFWQHAGRQTPGSPPPSVTKQAEVEAEIIRLEARVAGPRASVIHIASVIRLFDPRASDAQPRAHQRVTDAMKRSRLLDLCEAASRASSEPLDTRQFAQHIVAAEGWNPEDRTLRITVSHRIGLMPAECERRRTVQRAGERDRATVWRLPGRARSGSRRRRACGGWRSSNRRHPGVLPT